jgi:hypothetical protein
MRLRIPHAGRSLAALLAAALAAPPGAAAQDAAPGDAEPPAAVAQAEATGNPSQDQAAAIHANYDDTIDIYRGILDRERTDTGALDRRIASNEQLVERYRPLLARAEQELRGMQVQTFNRALQLKSKYEQGEISEQTYRDELAREEQELGERRERLEGDVSFYRAEVSAAAARLVELRTRREQMEQARQAAGVTGAETPAPGQTLISGLLSAMDELGVFPGPRFTMDGATGCRPCNAFEPHGHRD